ncbi:MAG: VCBS repeat-containing protein, partial [Caldilineaceae bacterium]|nr:VCBS repeat-containing protein [Caldilineaceae bacterium]
MMKVTSALRLLVLGAVAGLGLFLARPAYAQDPIFEEGEELTSFRGNTSQDVALGDLDNDGDFDAFVVQGSFGTAQANVIWRNNGTGSFSEDPQ